ncbi:hypothetical protein M8J75_004934 [Diaphorina citri]|nr:hypothetical protein M8J75_004934 [Diaphorina citri]
MASPLTAKQIGRDDDLVGNGGSQGNRNKTRVRSLGEKADYAGALGIIKIFSLSIGTENVAHMRGTRDNVPWCWNALHCWDEISSGTSAPSGTTLTTGQVNLSTGQLKDILSPRYCVDQYLTSLYTLYMVYTSDDKLQLLHAIMSFILLSSASVATGPIS